MTQRFDVILKGGTVVNQDGEGVRDIGITNGRIAELGPVEKPGDDAHDAGRRAVTFAWSIGLWSTVEALVPQRVSRIVSMPQ